MFGLKKIGEGKCKKSSEIKSSRIGLGMEKLDRIYMIRIHVMIKLRKRALNG